MYTQRLFCYHALTPKTSVKTKQMRNTFCSFLWCPLWQLQYVGYQCQIITGSQSLQRPCDPAVVVFVRRFDHFGVGTTLVTQLVADFRISQHMQTCLFRQQPLMDGAVTGRCLLNVKRSFTKIELQFIMLRVLSFSCLCP